MKSKWLFPIWFICVASLESGKRSANGTSEAVPERRCLRQTEADATTFSFFFRDERALVVAGASCTFSPSFSFCVIVAQTPPFFLSNLPDESVIVIFDCAQGGAIRSNKYTIVLSAGKQLPVNTDAHGNKLEKAAEIA